MAKLMQDLPKGFWTNPALARLRCTRAYVRDIFIRNGKYILAEGHMWTIKAEHLGAGAYEVTLVEGGGK